MVIGVETSGENVNTFIFSRYPDALGNHGEAELLVHGGVALAMPKFEHRESIERLKRSRYVGP